jgi:hypothetical protein
MQQMINQMFGEEHATATTDSHTKNYKTTITQDSSALKQQMQKQFQEQQD